MDHISAEAKAFEATKQMLEASGGTGRASLDGVGFVRDYGELSALKEFLDATVDHRHLNDVLGHDRTTAEVIGKWLYDWCKTRWPEVVAVRVSETPRTWAEYRP